MECIQNKKLIWWRDVPIDVEIGLVTYLSKVWNNDIYIISANDYEVARKQCSWTVDDFNNVHMIVGHLNTFENGKIIDALFNEDCIHIFSGIKGGHRVFLDRLNAAKNKQCVIIMESPSLYGSGLKYLLKKIAYPMIYRGYYNKYCTVISGLLTMGNSASALYRSYGWKNVFDFMYLPKTHSDKRDTTYEPCSKNVKMLYIGRFDYPAKGVNILMEAIDNLETTEEWSLDMVGGYGAQKNEVIDWCGQRKNVRFLGSWDSSKIIAQMSDYDFCVVPSIYDGWNLTPWQTIHAGIGCVISNNAGSQELILNSGAGVVVKKQDSNALMLAIKNAVENKNVIDSWKEKARQYVNKVSEENVGNYFLQILKYCFGEESQRPLCPW